MKFWISCILAILILIFAGFFVWSWWKSQLLPVVPGDQVQVNFVITKNESAGSVLARLTGERLIHNFWVSKLYLQGIGLDQKVRPGNYLLSRSQSLEELLVSLTAGPRDVWVTIPEGFRREQIAQRFESFDQFDKSEFLRLTATSEGKLFPDTYLVPLYATTENIVGMLLENFSTKVGEISQNNLIIASLVEREVRNPDDRPVIAGIIIKRLEAGWPLQIDATVQYAQDSAKCQGLRAKCEWWKPVSDTKLQSEYNTYINVGLPPAPIANPGIKAIEATKSFQKSAYWYYLSDSEGVTHFAKTLVEHNLNIDKYLND